MKNIVDITLMGSSSFNQEMEEANSNLESISEDEFMSISGDNNEEANFDQEIFPSDEKAADNILDELINEANKEDTIVSTVITNAVSYESVPQTASTSLPSDIQALIAKAMWEKKNIPKVKILNVQTLGAMRRFKEIQITKAPRSDPFGHLPRRLDFLFAQVNNVAKNLPTEVNKKFTLAASTIPNIFSDAIPQ
ncbi:hypothetical protein Tco_0646643 [Tanacetum coccineum]